MPSPGRPPGDAPVANPNKLLRFLALAPLLVSCVVGNQSPAQAHQSVLQRHESFHENLEHDHVSARIEATKVPLVDTPFQTSRRKNTLSVNNKEKYDASAIATLAPAPSAVAAPPTRRSNTSSAGLASPQIARSLEDWEVEDFVLLATIDGKLYAQDRKTGKPRWVVEAVDSVVNSTHYYQNQSSIEDDYNPIIIDDYIWAIEPTHDGSLYIYRKNGPSGNLVNTGLTMKKLVEELSPYSDADPAVTYTGEKKSTLLVIDAHDGNVVKFFGNSGPILKQQTCLNTNELSRKDTECKTSSTFTIGRTEYTVYINSEKDGHPIAKLQFSEWVPNNYDHDLQRQYRTTLDNKYIHTLTNGGIIGVDHNDENSGADGKTLFQDKLPSAVVRIFDIARPWGTEKEDPELIVLPQPMPPSQLEDAITANDRARSIFLNRTEAGSWFALSGSYYPTAVQGAEPALCQQQGWYPQRGWESMSNAQLSNALVGLHSIEYSRSDRSPLMIGGSNDSDYGISVPPEPPLTVPDWFWHLVAQVVIKLVDFVTNPMLLLLLLSVIVYKASELRVGLGRLGRLVASVRLEDLLNPFGGSKHLEPPFASESSSHDSINPANEKPNGLALDGPPDLPAVKVDEVEDKQVDVNPSPSTRLNRANSLEIPDSDAPGPETEKKKAHRGRRGGVKHKKGRNRAASQDASQEPKPPATVEDAVRDAQMLGEQPKLEPDIHTISHDPAEVSGPVIRVGALVVNTEKLIGTGSNGTMVFEGNFDGRDVAVKRMLIQFFDIASQETKLLRESDDHPNVIRYYAQQQAAGFLYIALELCPASLADIISKPQSHPELVQSGERDLPNVLYQIANGLQHLHNLRIVHRDLKPQNILVSMGKDGKPRLLVSDFGLCKKLEGEQSSFRATTAHAAGTTGWRAPELLLDDDAKINTSMVDGSTNGDSGSGVLVSADLMPNRRATRAIDIFSLGLVFFYVLTKGSHPFNSGGQWMREVNIRKGNYDLTPLNVLGDYAHEAKDLIISMLEMDPKRRPNARQVMAHPFFWSTKKRLNFLCDVSDHFEKEPRDPPSPALVKLEEWAPEVVRGDFLRHLPRDFIDSLGKQRKYTGTRLLDLLRALRNKKNHYEDLSDKLKREVGALPDGYLFFWTGRFSNLLVACWSVVYEVRWESTDRFRDYYLPAGL
jgi:serine/threonine-protein kinase/endoribonuclease IRE1